MQWRMFTGLLCGLLLSAPAYPAEPPTDKLEQMVEHQRRMILLLEGVEGGDPNDERIFAARNHYAGKLEITEELLESAAQAEGRQSTAAALVRFLDKAEGLHDADKLAFADLLEDLLFLEGERGAPVGELKRLNGEMEAILAAYRKEIAGLFSRLGMRGETKREAWSEYIDFLRSRYSIADLLSDFRKGQPRLNPDTRRGGTAAPKDPLLLWGHDLPEKTVVLTFDDGPHHGRTATILDTLKKYQVNGYFFSVGQKLGKVGSDGKARTGRDAAIAKRLVKEGHVLANHSYSHPILTRLKADEQAKELRQTNQLIASVAGAKASLFRPPYGSRSKPVLDAAKAERMRAVMWNIDSMDWADPVPESITKRVMDQLENQKRGIILFHDIHKPTVAALPLLLEELRKQKYRVVALDGSAFARGGSGLPFAAEEQPKPPYEKSWAVVIGINDYAGWPKLRYAVNDAKAVADILRTKLNFPRENIIELYDGDATRERIVQVLGDTLANPKQVGPEDRVFVFFAGHGMTRQLPSGRDLGYIIPVDADTEHYQARAISMSHLDDFSELIPAKHVYFVMDSCYSGLALTRAAGIDEQTSNYLTEITRRRARQILTAGGADQQVADSGPGGHSVFTWTLLQGLEGLADADGNGVITAAELGTYVAPIVSSYADQTPAFGNLVGGRGGEFVFQVDSAGLTAINQRLDAETRQLEKQLQALRAESREKLRKRLELQVALSKESAGDAAATRSGINDSEITEQRVQQARRLNAMALQYLAENRNEEALAELATAAELNPYNSTILNNYGFVLAKLNRHEEAVSWYHKTIELEPDRKVVQLNMAESLMRLGQEKEAERHYRRYLELFPTSPKANEVRERLRKLAIR